MQEIRIRTIIPGEQHSGNGIKYFIRAESDAVIDLDNCAIRPQFRSRITLAKMPDGTFENSAGQRFESVPALFPAPDTRRPSKGLAVYLLIPGDGNKCANGGISERYTRFIAIGCGMPEISSPSVDSPEVRIEEWYGHYRAIPIIRPERPHAGPAFSGCFLYSSDSRFSEITNGHPIPFHDRFEFERESDFLAS
jgi:hypothetical protein